MVAITTPWTTFHHICIAKTSKLHLERAKNNIEPKILTSPKLKSTHKRPRPFCYLQSASKHIVTTRHKRQFVVIPIFIMQSCIASCSWSLGALLLFIEVRGAVAFSVCFCFARAFLVLLLLCCLCSFVFGALQLGVLVVGGLKRQRAAKVEFYLGYPLVITDGDDLD